MLGFPYDLIMQSGEFVFTDIRQLIKGILDASGTHNLPHFNAEPSNIQTALPILHQHPRCVIAYSYIDQSEDLAVNSPYRETIPIVSIRHYNDSGNE
jgi:hypothetical protein